MATTIKLNCDICGKELPYKADYEKFSLQVIFTTEQTEGRSCKPYLSLQKVDICKECLDKITQGNYVYANGAQGYNNYYFKEDNK